MDACNARLWQFFYFMGGFMAQYDGSIRINTQINVKSAEAQLGVLEANISKSAAKIADLRAKLDSLKTAQIPTEEYSEISAQIEKARHSLDGLLEKQAQMQAEGKTSGASWDRIVAKIAETRNELSYANGELQALVSEGKAFTVGDTAQEEKLSQQLQTEEARLASMTQKRDLLNSKVQAAMEEEQRLASIKENATVTDQKLVDLLERRRQLLIQIKDLEKAGVTEGYAEYDNALADLSDVQAQINGIRDMRDAAAQARQSYVGLGETVRQVGRTMARGFVDIPIAAVKAGVRGLVSGFQKLGGVVRSVAVNSFRMLGNAIKNSLSRVGSLVGNVVSKMKLLGTTAKKSFGTVNKSAKKTGGLMGTIASRFKGIALSLLLFNWVTKAFNGVVKSIKDGFGNLYKDNEQFKASVDDLRASVLTLKNAFAAAFRPLVDVAIPYIQMAADKLTELLNKVGQFTAAITGQTTYTKAIKQTADAFKDAKKAAEGYLSPLDEINKFSSKKDEDEEQTGVMFEEVPIEQKFKELAQKLKDMWAKSDFSDLGKTLGENLKKSLDNIPWGKIKKTARKIGKNIATLVNGFVEVKKLGYSIGKTLAEAINTGFEFLNNFVHGLHWDSIGKFIADTLNGFFQSIDWELIYDTFVTGAKGLGDAINSFVDNLDWDSISSTIANFVNTFVDTVYTFFTTVNWSELGTRIGETLTETIKKIDFEKIGRAIGSVIQAAIDFVKNLISELSFEDIKNAITDLLSGLFDELGVTFPASFEEFGNLVSDAVIKSFSFIKDTIAGIKWDEIGSSIAEFINGIKWDEVSKAFFDSCTTAINSAVDLVYNFVKETKWDEIAEEIGNSFNESLKDLDSEKLGHTIGAALQAAIDFLKTFVKTINWKDVVDAIKDALKGFMEEVDMSDVADIILTLLSAKLVIAAGKFVFSSAAAAIMGSIKNALLGSASVAEATATGNAIGESITSGLIVALLDGAVATAAVVGSYKLLTGNLEELFGAFGRSTDQGKRLEERYEGLDGAARFAKDGIDILKNGIEGYGFAADNCVGSGVALEKAMEDIQNGAILTDEHMAQLQERFGLTDEDMEMLRQEMLDCNPILREIADNLGFEDASPETLQDIAEGFSMIANGTAPLPDDLANMTEEARGFMERVMESETPMVVFGEKLENIGAISDNTSKSLNDTGKSISDGLTKGMEEADVEAGSENLFSRIVGKIKELFGIHSPSTVMAEIGTYIVQGLIDGINSLSENLSSIWQSMKDKAEEIWEGVKESLSEKWENINASAQEKFELLKENVSEKWNLLKENTEEIWGEIKEKLEDKWEDLKESAKDSFENMKQSAHENFEKIKEKAGSLKEKFDDLKEKTKSAFSSMKDHIESASESMNGKLDGFISKVKDAIEAVKDFLRSGWDKVKSGFGGGDSGQNYSSRTYSMRSLSAPAVHPAIAKLANIDIPGYATGQVIPTSMKRHLAWLGDNPRETEVVSPLSTIEQAVINAMAKVGAVGNGGNAGGNTYNVKAIANGNIIFDMIIEEGKTRMMSSGRNPFDLNTT